MKRHKHADLIAKWIEDISQEVEVFDESTQKWRIAPSPCWWEDMEYRIKPNTIMIGGFEINKPEQDAPKYNTLYYVPFFGNVEGYFDSYWVGSDHDYRMLEMNLVHLKKEGAIQHTKALICISGEIV